MALRFARHESVGAAIVTTLKPGSMCSLCHAVKQAREQRPESPVLPPDDAKPAIVFLALPGVVLPEPRGVLFQAGEAGETGIGRARPPLPPPRLRACA